jgi:hypothetical protein
MINLYYSASSSTFVMYPDETPFSASLNPYYRLSLSQSLDNSNSLVTLSRLNTRSPKNDSSVLVLQALTGSGIPTASGQYQADLLYQSEPARGKWGNTNRQFGSIHEVWSNVKAGFIPSEATIISEDRAYVFGTNEEVITTNTQTDQLGSYTTYNS